MFPKAWTTLEKVEQGMNYKSHSTRISWSQLDLSILITGGNLKPGNCLENPVSLNFFLSISELKTTSLTGDLHDRGGPPSVSPCCASFRLHSQSYCSAAFATGFGYFPYFHWSSYPLSTLYQLFLQVSCLSFPTFRLSTPLFVSLPPYVFSSFQFLFLTFQYHCELCWDY